KDKRVDDRRVNGRLVNEIFVEAQRLVRWHYQWIIVNHYLPKIVGPDVVDSVDARGRKFFNWSGPHPFTPVEFSAAAFRFGHSQVRPAYRVNPGLASSVFSLRGGRRLNQDHKVEWSQFFSFPDIAELPLKSMTIDTKISGPLFQLPLGVVNPSKPIERSLP